LPLPLKICLADIKSEIGKANDYYRKKNYAQAEAIYQSVIRKAPGSGFAGRSRKKLSAIDIALNRNASASTIVSKPESELPEELIIQNKKIANIGREYKKALDINKVGKLSKLYNLTEDAQAKKETDILRLEAKKNAALLKYRDTKSGYQAIVDNKPGTDEASRALTYIAILEIAAGNDSAAEAACNKLFADFKYHDNILKIMETLASKYTDAGKYD
jgi:tetratricopeptide (TPR) repeat protein